MSGLLGSICHRCCPWLSLKASSQAEGSTQLPEAEDESFMRPSIETSIETTMEAPSKSLPDNQYGKAISPVQTEGHELNTISVQNQQLKEGSSSPLELISPQHPYFQLLEEKLEMIDEVFQEEGEAENKIPETSYGLKVYVNTHWDDKRNIYVYHFTFPTTFQFYEKMQNNFELQKSFDPNIDVYECRDRIDDSTKIIYLSYKKVLIISPRDFVYVRYQFKRGNEYWIIATSIQEPAIENKARGQIILTATRAIEENGQLKLSVYSEIDMKLNIRASASKARGLTEIKKYLDKCLAYIEEEKSSFL